MNLTKELFILSFKVVNDKRKLNREKKIREDMRKQSINFRLIFGLSRFNPNCYVKQKENVYDAVSRVATSTSSKKFKQKLIK